MQIQEMEWVWLVDIEDKCDLTGFPTVWNPEVRTPLIDDMMYDSPEDEEWTLECTY